MEKELVEKAKSGDVSAFTELILSLQQDLYKIAKTRLSQEADINDAVQETILSAYQAINKLNNCSTFKSWLIKILINKCNDIYKLQHKISSVSYEATECENYVSPSSSLDSNLEFNSLMKLLDYEERLILVLYYYEGYKSNEISKILNMKDSTVRSKILRAKKKIENNLKEVL